MKKAILFLLFIVLSQSSYGQQDLHTTLGVGNTTDLTIKHVATGNGINTWFGEPVNYGTTYGGGTYGIAQRFMAGWNNFTGVNGSGRPNAVGTFWGYNHGLGGSRENNSEAGFGFRTETHYEAAGMQLFELHLPEFTDVGGTAHRLFSFYIDKSGTNHAGPALEGAGIGFTKWGDQGTTWGYINEGADFTLYSAFNTGARPRFRLGSLQGVHWWNPNWNYGFEYVDSFYFQMGRPSINATTSMLDNFRIGGSGSAERYLAVTGYTSMTSNALLPVLQVLHTNASQSQVATFGGASGGVFEVYKDYYVGLKPHIQLADMTFTNNSALWADNGTTLHFKVAGTAGDGFVFTNNDGNVELMRIDDGGSFVNIKAPLIKVGGTTSSFPALKRSSANLQVRLADDSAPSDLEVAGETYGSGWNASDEVPTKNDVYDKVEAVITAAAPASGSASYIQNQNASTQTANFKINGTGEVGILSATGNAGVGGNLVVTGSVGIGTAPSAYDLDVDRDVHIGGNLEVDDNVYITGTANVTSGTWTSSDARFKKNVGSVNDIKDQLLKIASKKYDFKCEEFKERNFDNRSHFGFIAQEIEKIFPELVKKDNKGYYTVNYTEFIPLLLQAIREQDQDISNQRQVYEESSSNIARLQNEIEELKISMKECCQSNIGKTSNVREVQYQPVTSTLAQNIPNPTRGETVIGFNIVGDFGRAFIGVYDLNGRELKRIPIAKGMKDVRIEKGQLASGQYVYSLIVDNNLIDSKKMVVIEQ